MVFVQVGAQQRSMRCDGGCNAHMPVGAWAFSCESCDTDVCVGCTADGAGGRVEVRVVNGKRAAREEEVQGGGGDKRQRRLGAAPAAEGPAEAAGEGTAAAGGPGEVESQGGEGRGTRRRKAKRKRHSAPS